MKIDAASADASDEAAKQFAARITNANIGLITALEQEALNARTPGERLGDAIARGAGKVWFVAAHGFWFVAWICLNSKALTGMRPFDPFPYPFLTFIVSLEAIFLSMFILMSQNRGNRQAEHRAHLNLQINLLAEQESTKTLEMLQKLCEYHGLQRAHDPEVEGLKAATNPQELLRELKANLPTE